MKNTLHFKINGMHCVTCATRVERAIASVEGVKKAHVNFVNEKAEAEVDISSPALIKTIENAIQKEGYEAAFLPHKK